MSKRIKGLRAAEILLAAAFVILLIVVESSYVSSWFFNSMDNALKKLESSISDSAENTVNDFEQQYWSHERLMKLAAYYVENDAVDEDTEDSLRELCSLFGAEGAYTINQKGKLIAGYGPVSDKKVFQEECFAPLRAVTKENPGSDPVAGSEVPEYIAQETDDSTPLFLSYYLNPEKILVMQRRMTYYGASTEHRTLQWDGILSNRVFGSDSFCFGAYEGDWRIFFLSDEDEEAHPDLADAKVPESAGENGFRGIIKPGEQAYFCCSRYNDFSESYLYCAIPFSSFALTVLFVSVCVLIVVFFFLALMRMVARLLLPDAIRDAKKKAPEHAYRKHLSLLLLVSVMITLAVNIFINTLFLYTERIETDSAQSAQLSDILDGFEEKQQESSHVYNAYIAAITQAAADLIPHNEEFMKSAKLQELADVMGAARILVYDNSGTVVASSRNYNGLALSENPEDMSWQFRWVLRGEPMLVQDKPDEVYLNTPYRFSGAPMMDGEGNFTGLAQIAMDPSVYDSMESSLSLKSILSAFETNTNTVMAVDAGTGKVYSADDSYMGQTAESLGIAEEVLQDEFTGFFQIRKNEVIGSCHNSGEYHALVASLTKGIPAVGLRSGALTALPGVLTEVIFFLILLLFEKKCETMTEEEIRQFERGRKKEEKLVTEQINLFTCRYLFALAGIISVMYIFRYSLFTKDSIQYYIFVNEWAKGFHIFSVTRCIIYIAVAVFSVVTVSTLLTGFARLLMSRQETFIRLGLSFLKYGVGIATVFLCASTLGAPTASLLASAGILSVMLSFGAQTIVADIISGLFIVFEGTFKVGDMITVDGWHGQVQEIGIRNTKMRDLISEDIKIINNSTIRTIINYSERPCWTPILVGVDYATDIPAMEAAFEREKAAMKKNIPLGIGEIVYMGIDELSDSQMTLKFQIQCRNQDQPKVKRALNREIRMMFARNGITIPFPQVTFSAREEPEENRTEEEPEEQPEEKTDG